MEEVDGKYGDYGSSKFGTQDEGGLLWYARAKDPDTLRELEIRRQRRCMYVCMYVCIHALSTVDQDSARTYYKMQPRPFQFSCQQPPSERDGT